MIYRATLEDASELSDLVNSAYRGDSSRQGWTTEADLLDGTRTDAEIVRELIQQPDTIILKYSDGLKIIGCVELIKNGDQLYLGMLTVSPAQQGKGIGKELLVAAETEARKLGCTAIFMTVISVRTDLIPWYIRHGYRDTGQRKPFELPDPRWGIPRQPMEFMILEKRILL